MNLPACIHCAHAPERRESGAWVLYVCPVCNARGAAATCESWAVETWRQVNREDLPVCGCDSRPRFKVRHSKWWASCPGCRRLAGGYLSIQGAVAGWIRSFR